MYFKLLYHLYSFHKHAASSEKLQALTLAESMMSILGESWLLQQMSLPGEDPIPVDRSAYILVKVHYLC